MRQINRILCPVDLSDVSRHAIEHAVLLAGRWRSTIAAVHVSNPIVIPSTDFSLVGMPVPPVMTDEQVAELRQQVSAWFPSPGLAPEDVIIENGHPAKRILAIAARLPADMIVMGTHGRSGFEHLVLGSVAEKVLRQAVCPVMTVPPRAQATSTWPFKRIVCPVDFSAASLAAFEFANAMARDGDADLTLVHVLEWPHEPLETRPFAVPEFSQRLERDAVMDLEQLAVETRSGARLAHTRLERGKAYREVLRVAAEERADLVVMGVHGRNALDVMLFGSTTNQVVRRATCPVLTVRT